MSVLVLCAAAALGAANPNYILNEPVSRGSLREVLLECTPYPYGRSRIVSRAMPATPEFIIDGERVLSRTPADQPWCATPGPAWYGAPADTFVRAHALVGEVAISFDPFSSFRPGTPGQLYRAQRYWLNESGMVNQARLVRRAVRPASVEAQSEGAAPEPIMIIPVPGKKPSTRDLPLEVHRLSPSRVLITDGSVPGPVETASLQR